ncbi:lysophospholipid acyltransferase family protein [Gordonia aurantiaca]|uniref:lysophospholipid acyltransferase family protein n=1 Tax=Gordonia sp. B21 TaxID=3151852 RepID=UPI00326707EB
MSALLVPDLAAADRSAAGSRASSSLHAWFPVSTCGSRCLRPRDRRGLDRLGDLVRAGWRATRLVAVIARFVVPGVAGDRAGRSPGRRSRASRACLAALGIRTVIDDRRSGAQRATPALVVANHISYLDILALSLVVPAPVVAKSEVLDMPLVASAARRCGVIGVDRRRLRDLPATVDEVTARLRRGESVIVFPEGTTFCGREAGAFRPAFFQAAVDAGVPVLPVGLRFRGNGGRPAPEPGFIGDDTPLATLGRVLTARGLVVEVRLGPLEPPRVDRRELAARCRRVVVGERRGEKWRPGK